jgi:poly(hydroxyalkanoate) depolymerase family esterase
MKNLKRFTFLQLTNEASFKNRGAKATIRLFKRIAGNFGRMLRFPHTFPESNKGEAKQKTAVKTNAQWLAKSFQNADGQRNYRVYVPSTYHGQALPLVVMLHGANQDAEDFAAGTQMNRVAEAQQYIVAYPEQPLSASLIKCWHWFRPMDQLRDSGEPSIIAGITREVIQTYNADPRRVYIAGMSAGGAMAVNLAETYPDIYAAAGIHSGLPYGVADELFSALAAMNDGLRKTGPRPPVDDIIPLQPVPLIVFHGDRDHIVHPRNSDALMAINTPVADGRVEAPEETRSPAATRSDNLSNGYSYTRTVFRDDAGVTVGEQWLVHELGHAWSGGDSAGTYTDARGPDASHHMIRFFAAIKKAATARSASYPSVRPLPRRRLAGLIPQP